MASRPSERCIEPLSLLSGTRVSRKSQPQGGRVIVSPWQGGGSGEKLGSVLFAWELTDWQRLRTERNGVISVHPSQEMRYSSA